MPNEIQGLTTRYHRAELDALHRIATQNNVAVGVVIRAFVRHFLVLFEKGQPPPADLGAIHWEVKDWPGQG